MALHLLAVFFCKYDQNIYLGIFFSGYTAGLHRRTTGDSPCNNYLIDKIRRRKTLHRIIVIKYAEDRYRGLTIFTLMSAEKDWLKTSV